MTSMKLLPMLAERTGMSSLIKTQDTQESRQQVLVSLKLFKLSSQSHTENELI